MHSTTLIAFVLVAAAPALSVPLAPSSATVPAPNTAVPITVPVTGSPPSSLDDSGALTLEQIEKGIDAAHAVANGVNTGLDFFSQHFGKNKDQKPQQRRQEEEGSGAVSLDSVDRGIDVGHKGVGLVDSLTDVADKIKHLIKDKRDDTHDQDLLKTALAHFHGHYARRQDADGSSGAAVTLDHVDKGLDVGGKGVGLIDSLTNVADKIKHLIKDKRDVDSLVHGLLQHLGTVQARGPYVLPNGAPSGKSRLPPLNHGNGWPDLVAVPTRSLDELD